MLHLVRPNSKEKKVTLVLDVAHNPPAIARLVTLLQKKYPRKKYRFVCGFSADKDIANVMQQLTSITDQSRIHLVRANHPRGATLEEINAALINSSRSNDSTPETFGSISAVADGVEQAIVASRACQDNEDEQELVVICGSVFLMAEARQTLGFQDPIDSPALNAVAGSHLTTPAMRLSANKPL